MMFKRVEVKFKVSVLPTYIISVDGTTHRIIRLDNNEFLMITFDNDGSIFDLRKYQTFEFIKKHFNRYGLYLECEPTLQSDNFEYIGTRKISYTRGVYPVIHLPKLSQKFLETDIYYNKNNKVLLVFRK